MAFRARKVFGTFEKRASGQSFSLSLCGLNSISRANVHMVYMGRKLALHITLL